MKPTPSKKVIYSLAAFFAISGLLMLAATAWSYLDEHSGRAAKATVTHCESHGSGKGSSLYCTGHWTVDEREHTGDVFNARRGDVGKTISVRLHGNHASKPQLWVTIALGVMGLVIFGFAPWLLVMSRRRPPLPPPEPSALELP